VLVRAADVRVTRPLMAQHRNLAPAEAETVDEALEGDLALS